MRNDKGMLWYMIVLEHALDNVDEVGTRDDSESEPDPDFLPYLTLPLKRQSDLP